MSALTLTPRTEGAWVVLEVAGELDFHTAPQVRAAVLDLRLSPLRGLVLDLAGLTFCDSSGITAFIIARAVAVDAGAPIALAALPERVERTFAVVGLSAVFTVHPTAAEAVAAALR